MKHFKSIFLIFLFYSISPAHSQQATTCEQLKNLSVLEISTGKASREAVLDCRQKGEDPPLEYRKAMGALPIVTPVGNQYKLGPCRPTLKKQCPNNLREYTDGGNSSSGYIPAQNDNLKKPPVPWGDLNDNRIPCGAITTFAKNALRGLLTKGTNVTISTPASGMVNTLSNQLNGMVTGALANFFKHKDCSGGQFWGILNYIFTLVMGHHGNFHYDHTNNTFRSNSSPIIVTMPVGTTINMQLGGGKINPIILPMGGAITNQSGGQVNFGHNTKVSFRSDGIISTSNGNRFRVNPNETITLDPNEMIQIPPGTSIPVDPKSKVYPMGSVDKEPDWYADYIASTAR